ncbi:glucan endo-1,3-beta-glucosidase 9 [Ipomoea triloba]|uniref:glucan endo-1,3-beta-glucosidase 9 n=1 Tax=Ipomoea triloba TaxID=35885 RepID=UPI00125D2063|nr:glucan endo-1,3-beta-glucosidase 9 [Ipomoea triloba]
MASPTALLATCVLFLIVPTLFPVSVGAVGVNWGRAASHPLPADKVVQILKANGIAKVKLSEPYPEALESLSGAKIDVTVSIPDSMLRGLNSSLKAAQSWVHDNITRYFSEASSKVRIEYISIGDEPFLETYGTQFHPFLIGAATNIHTALVKANLEKEIKVVIPCSFDAFLSETGMPSRGHFRADINKTMIQVLKFLSQRQSPLFVTISPFQSYRQNKNISLDFALFKETARPHNYSRKTYKNSFDLSCDTLVSALSSAGFPQMDIVVGQIGWPTDGAANATSSNAEVFLKGLMERLHSKSGTSSKATKLPLETYILSLLDEDKRSVASGSFERHWGVFTFDGQAKYHVDFGQGSRKMVDAQNVQYLSSKWCVVNNNKDLSNATAQAIDACSSADCSALSPGGSCFNISWPGNISYAFNNYYQQNNQNADSCNFGGLGLITTVDPSVEPCRFLVQLKTSVSVSLLPSALFHLLASPVVSILLWLLNGI